MPATVYINHAKTVRHRHRHHDRSGRDHHLPEQEERKLQF